MYACIIEAASKRKREREREREENERVYARRPACGEHMGRKVPVPTHTFSRRASAYIYARLSLGVAAAILNSSAFLQRGRERERARRGTKRESKREKEQRQAPFADALGRFYFPSVKKSRAARSPRGQYR